MNHPHTISTVDSSRRRFLQQSGGILFYVSTSLSLSSLVSCSEEGRPENESSYEGKTVNLWVQIHENDQLTFMNPASEMGQGSMTALALILAEELDADWSKVHIEHSPVEPEQYGSGSWGGRKRMITVGSRTVMSYYDQLRQAGAQARYALLANVARHWQVPIKELSTAPHRVLHARSDRQVSYGEIAAFFQPPAEIPEIPEDQLKDPADFRLIGKVTSRFDIPAKTDGSALYASDVRLPAMVYGAISRAPVHGSSPMLRNEKSIRGMDGVLEVVSLDHGIGVVAETLEAALRAKDALEIEWSEGGSAETHHSESAFIQYAKEASREGGDGRVLEEEGSVSSAFSSAARTYSADYLNDYVYHCQMEPLNAVVSVREDGSGAEVWVGTQHPDGARSAVAEALGIDRADVTLHPHYLGGGFGRRSAADYVVEAALLAKEIQRPVKLIWTREDDIQYGMFRPMSLQRMQASVDEEGNVTGWKHLIIGTGGGLLSSGARPEFYSLPSRRIEVRSTDHGIRTKHWRAVGHGPNKFAIEAFLDEIAADQGVDPFAFRMRLMKDNPRAQSVLKKAVELAKAAGPPPQGRARGMAFAERSSSLAACVCEISMTEEDEINVHRIWASLDAGVVVQPDNAIAQME